MFYEDPETGRRVPYSDLQVLHDNQWLPGFEHIPDWLRIDLIERDSQLVRAYLRSPSTPSIRRELSRKIVARLQSELDNVLTARREIESKDEQATKAYYFIKWALEQMRTVLTSKSIHKGFSKLEYDTLMAKHDELNEHLAEISRRSPSWTFHIGMDRWDSLRLEKALFEEMQAMQRMDACLPRTPLNEDIDLDDQNPDN